uniref:WHEP-TRS domain-containing protein n=1 Tax=Brassica campestris TaxID=3711 RepID=M4CEX2_BRACM
MTHEMTDQQTAVSLANDGGNEAELTDQKVLSHWWIRTEEQGKETFSIIVANDGSSSSANLQVMLAATIDNGCLKIPLQEVSSPKEGAFSSPTVEKSSFSDHVLVKSILCRSDSGSGLTGQKVRIFGWVRTRRLQGKGSFTFLEVNDGSCPAYLQVIVDASLSDDLSKVIAKGTCVVVDECLKLPPQGTKQKIELKVEEVVSVGTVDQVTYPFPKNKPSPEHLRKYLHLCARTNLIASVASIRNAFAFATYSFFQSQSFLYVNTPIITTSDCEGAGEMFQVTMLISAAEKLERELIENPPPTEADVEAARVVVKERGVAVAQLKSAKANEQEITASLAELTDAKLSLAMIEERSRLKPGFYLKKMEKLIILKTFWVGKLSCLFLVSYSLRATLVLLATALVEPELALADLEEDMDCAEAYVRYMCTWLLDNCYDDLEVMAKNVDDGCIDRLKLVASTPFVRVTYTDTIELLKEAVAQGETFGNQVEWGIDLASDHERYLTEVVFQKPVIVYNYPKGIKAFYMRLNDDGKTVAAMDVLVPKEMGLPVEPYEWYLDLRRHGTVKHSGFGLGFERMVLFATGMDNIRDVIPFPRYPGRADL